jgi:xylan 1,4-beta-xylosidase
MATIRKYSQLQQLPLVIGESDPEGCAACGMSTNPENAYRNGTMYSSYEAAAFARKYLLADSFNVNLIGAVSWAFEFENQPWFAGYRDLATNGVDKPVLNVFRMFGMMTGKRVAVAGNRMYSLEQFVDSSVRGTTDIGVLAAKDKRAATIMLWNYHDEDKLDSGESVGVWIYGIPATSLSLIEYRIDQSHSNSYTAWKNMGSPQNPTNEQIRLLEKAGQLAIIEKVKTIEPNNGVLLLMIELPRQAVSLVKLSW